MKRDPRITADDPFVRFMRDKSVRDFGLKQLREIWKSQLFKDFAAKYPKSESVNREAQSPAPSRPDQTTTVSRSPGRT